MKFLFLFLSLFCSIALATPIKVNLDRNRINLNESFQVEFETTQDPNANPDFKPLETDFEIIDLNHSSQMSWVNGVGSNSIKWTFILMAKKTGELVIPALKFGSETSPPAKITVIKNQQPELLNDAPLFLQVDVDKENPYIQSQVIYRLRFFRQQNIQIAEARLSDLILDDAMVEKLGNTEEYKTDIKGQPYIVSEVKYAVFPQKSGALEIPSMSLTVAVVANSRTRLNRMFGSYSTRREVLASQIISLDVKPTPADVKDKKWLVSEQVYIEQKWSGDINTLKVGEPLTRTLRLFAKGVMGSQLPVLQDEMMEGADLRSYPDKAKIEEQKSTKGIVGFREEKIAFIPSKAGTYTLPEIKIVWFNLRTQQQETASIPATTITAIATASSSTPQVPPVVVVDETHKPVSTPINTVIETIENPLWKWLTAIFASCWLVTLGFFLTRKKAPEKDETINEERELKHKQLVKSLKKSCLENDAQAAKDLLLLWGKNEYQAMTLGAIAEHCDARLHDEIMLLNQFLYSADSKTWQGKKLFQTFSEHRAMKKVNQPADDVLEPLYRL